MIENRSATVPFVPGPLLRQFRAYSFNRKLGLGEQIWARRLAGHGVTWVAFDNLIWKLNLANDTHRWLVYGEYEEPGVRRLLTRVLQPDSVIIDSGANIGQMILMYLRCGAPAMIHAFEPTPEAREWLEECVTANQLSNVRVSPFALGEQAGPANLLANFSLQEGARNFIHRRDDGLPIKVTTLDVYAAETGLEQIRFWKLDTEGHELPALLGAGALLRRAAIDYLYVETADAGNSIKDLLGQSGYVATTLALDRVLTRPEVSANFNTVFISPRVAREECSLVMAD